MSARSSLARLRILLLALAAAAGLAVSPSAALAHSDRGAAPQHAEVAAGAFVSAAAHPSAQAVPDTPGGTNRFVDPACCCGFTSCSPGVAIANEAPTLLAGPTRADGDETSRSIFGRPIDPADPPPRSR